MSLGLQIYPIRHSNLFIPGRTYITEDTLIFRSSTDFLTNLKESEVLQHLPGGLTIEYANGEETCTDNQSLRVGETLFVSYGDRLKPWLSNQIDEGNIPDDWDLAIVKFLLSLPDSTPIVFNWQ